MNRLKNFLRHYPMRLIMSPTIIFSVFLILLSAWPGWGATYYIDPTCSSSGNGTTTTCGTNGPFKTWAEITSKNLWAAGNTYSQKGGTTAYETVTVGASGTVGNVITINSYGTGKAILNGRITIPDVAWTGPDVDGVYYQATPGGYYLLEDNVFLQWATDKAHLGINGNWVSWYGGDGKNYYKPTNRVFAGHTREEVRSTGIQTGSKEYITINNLSFTKYVSCIRATQSVKGNGFKNITITNCDFSNSRYGMWLYTWDTHSSNLTVQNNTFSYVQSGIEFGETALDSGLISDVTTYDISYNTMTHIGNIYTPSGPASYYWNKVYQATPLGYEPGSNDLEGIGIQNGINGNIHHNTISGNTRGIVVYTGKNNSTTGNNIYNNYVNTYFWGIVIAPHTLATEQSNNNIHHNIIISNPGYAAWFTNIATPVATYNYFNNNTVYAYDYGIKFGTIADYWSLKNNIIYGSTGRHIIWTDAVPLKHFIIDDNLYYPDGTKWNIFSGSKTWAQWKALGFDTNSPTPADPLFTNRSGRLSVPSDFTSQSTSPAKWAGGEVGLTTDYAGNPVHSPPSIGAYEYVGTPRPAAPTGLKVQ